MPDLHDDPSPTFSSPPDIGAICWFRRDLRLADNGTLADALHFTRENGGRVLCVFVFDTDILDRLVDKDDRRVSFIATSVAELATALARLGGGLHVMHGSARIAIPSLVEGIGRVPVFASADHDRLSLSRDDLVGRKLTQLGSSLRLREDHVVVPTHAILSGSSQPYRVFTPFFRAWSARLEMDADFFLPARPSHLAQGRLAAPLEGPLTAQRFLERTGFRQAPDLVALPGESAAQTVLSRFLSRIDGYPADRDLPGTDATSKLSPHLRFGTVSARQLVRLGRSTPSPGSSKWISEIAWRDFYQMLLRHFPETVDHAFQKKLEHVAWDDPRTDPVAATRFEAWKAGKTGYPFVDAAMRELRATGWMHNRCRMVVASFLTKDLHIHWKRGERWFARWLLDIELASNVGGWQWSAGTGADAQPWFRIFNPIEQSRRWDPTGAWIKSWCPELQSLPDRWLHAPWTAPASQLEQAGIRLGEHWPFPVVDHTVERIETLERFGRVARASGSNS